MIVAHGNSLRALVKHLDKISDDKILGLNIPTGTPLVYELDEDLNPLKNYYLGNQDEINELFDILIDKTSLENEVKNLNIYKKALYNADNIDENNLLKILSPLINSDSVWKSHALYLVAEFFYFKGEKQKSKEFFNKILILENSDKELKLKAQRILNRDLSD